MCVNRFRKIIAHLSVSITPRRLWVSLLWIIWWAQSDGPGVWRPLVSLHFLLLLNCTAGEMKGGEAEGRGGGGREMSARSLGLSVISAPSCLTEEQLPKLRAPSHLWNGTAVAVPQGCGHDYLRKCMWGKWVIKCQVYSQVDAEIGLCTCVTCVV